MDNKGTSTIEIAIILIIILMIFGVILSSIENSQNKVIKAEEINNIEKMTSEFMDNLINNPGTPENWNEYEKGTPGLAIVSDGNVIPNSVSYSKLIALGENYEKFVNQKIFNSEIHTSMELVPYNTNIASVKIGSNDEGENIFSINRYVKCDFYKNYVLKDLQIDGKCNRNHDQSQCSCNYFKSFKGNLRQTDYYLLLDDGEKYNVKYFVDTTRVVKGKVWQTVTSDKIYLNDKFDFYDDTSAIVFVHLDKAKTKAVIVSVPKNFDKDKLKYDYFITNECNLILKSWY